MNGCNWDEGYNIFRLENVCFIEGAKSNGDLCHPNKHTLCQNIPASARYFHWAQILGVRYRRHAVQASPVSLPLFSVCRMPVAAAILFHIDQAPICKRLLVV